MNLIHSNHLSQEVILRFLDDEIGASERVAVELHLAQCDVCRGELAVWEGLSLRIDSVVQTTAVPAMSDVRLKLENRLQSKASQAPVPHPSHVLRRFGWGMGIAATLAFGVLLAPRYDLNLFPDRSLAPNAPVLAQSSVIEINGETFLPVPSSNADLGTSIPQIVQMQVPVSSLADIGIIFEPVTNRVSSGSETERSVLADVLVGADGQPRGVHVVGLE